MCTALCNVIVPSQPSRFIDSYNPCNKQPAKNESNLTIVRLLLDSCQPRPFLIETKYSSSDVIALIRESFTSTSIVYGDNTMSFLRLLAAFANTFRFEALVT